MIRYNKPKNLRQSDVIDAVDSFATDLPGSANAVRMAFDRIAWGAPIAPVAATLMLTIGAQPADGDEIVIGNEEYVFVEEESETAPETYTEVKIGETLTATRTSLRTALGSSEIFSVGTWSSSSLKLTAKVKGTAAHNIVVEGSFESEENEFGAEAFAGGVDGTVANKGSIRVDADNIYVSVDDSTVAIGNWKTVSLSS